MDEVKNEILNEMIYYEIKNAMIDENSINTISKLSDKLKISKSLIRTYVNAITIYEIVTFFLENSNLTINEVARKMNVPSSTIQRYLTSELIDEIPEFRGKNISEKIRKMSDLKKKLGNQKGGIISAQNNIYQKDKNGAFQGCKKR